MIVAFLKKGKCQEGSSYIGTRMSVKDYDGNDGNAVMVPVLFTIQRMFTKTCDLISSCTFQSQIAKVVEFCKIWNKG